MEAVLLQSSPDQSISAHKQFRSSKKNSSRRSENFAPSKFYGGLLHAPPCSLSFTYPPLAALVNQQQQQPPLLPLPNPKPNNNNPRSRGLSCSPINRKINSRKRDQSLTPKKFKPPVSPKQATSSAERLIIASTNPLGPNPNCLPKDVSVVLSSSAGDYSDLEKFSGSVVFTPSPPPSSLPLPTFSLRPKLSCNAEATGIDTGATDNLRRLLRLH